MNNVDLYKDNNSLQKRDSYEIVLEYTNKILWRVEGDRTIDIGCGDGGVTKEILVKFLPVNYDLLMGCDINADMVGHANRHHADERTRFCQLDIEGDLAEQLHNVFHHAFSFFVLHWVRDQRRALTNIFNLLTPGGDTLNIFLTQMPWFDTFRILSRYEKWKSIMWNVEKYISPYHDSKDPEREVREMMEQIGFKNVKVISYRRKFDFDNIAAMNRFQQAVNPFKIPDDRIEEYNNDYLDVLWKMKLLDKQHYSPIEPVSINGGYGIIVAYGSS